GVYRNLVSRPLRLFGAETSVYAGSRGTKFDWGVRAQLRSPFLRIGVGADYSGVYRRTDFLLSIVHPVRRGGIFGFGSSLRLDYLPSRNHSLAVGFELPVGRTLPMGRTRPRDSAVRLTIPDSGPVPNVSLPTSLLDAMQGVEDAAHWIRRLTVPYMEHPGWSDEGPTQPFLDALSGIERHVAETGGLYPRGRPLSEEVSVYHAELDRAFTIAVSGVELEPGQHAPAGLRVSREARRILLDEVLLPYDRLLGQRKDEDTTLAFAARARGAFVRWLSIESAVPPERLGPTLWVFTRLLEIVEANREEARLEWDDSRFVWLPLQWALEPGEHDSQAELDALVERAINRQFTEGNRISYVINEQFDYQLGRMIHEAQDYHVLWIHDFPARNDEGNPDEVAYAQVLDSYLAALVDKVGAYDDTGRLPVYMIFIDEWFYSARDGHVWMDFLEDPLEHRLDLPSGFEEWEESIDRAREALRLAVAESQLLQAEAAQYGEAWLRNRIKVHVSVTNRSDASFWSPEIFPLIGMPDNVMRDHRKVSFYDISEDDPYRGEAIYTGAGVGEHYASLAWEDRSMLVRGPAALGAKKAARDLLLNQGVPPGEIPYHLQPRPMPAD
ncbi:MAG TPA: hypothetical protein VIE88_18565, partial [Vicinamibacteria bacterium]